MKIELSTVFYICMNFWVKKDKKRDCVFVYLMIKCNHNSWKGKIFMRNFGLQLYTIRRELGTENDRKILEYVKSLGYSYVQAAGDFASIERLGKIANDIGLATIGSVTSLDSVLENFEEAVRSHKSIGAFDIGVSAKFSSSAEVVDFIKKANELSERLFEYRISFSYHNHSNEFITLDNGRCAYDMLIDGLTSKNAFFMPDTYWIQHGGADVRYYIEKLKGRIKILHMKDAKMKDEGITFGEIGKGNLYWDGILESARCSGVEYFVVEQDKCDISPLESIKLSADCLSNM